MLRSLDLFSGIGGFSHALRGIARPVAYCEIDSFATSVLRARMAGGDLPEAPLCPDIVQLNRSWLDANADGGAEVDVVTAGFPCQGFSRLGLLKGQAARPGTQGLGPATRTVAPVCLSTSCDWWVNCSPPSFFSKTCLDSFPWE